MIIILRTFYTDSPSFFFQTETGRDMLWGTTSQEATFTAQDAYPSIKSITRMCAPANVSRPDPLLLTTYVFGDHLV